MSDTNASKDVITPVLLLALLASGVAVLLKQFPEYIPFQSGPEGKVNDFVDYVTTSGLAVFSFLGAAFTRDKWLPMLMYVLKYLAGVSNTTDSDEKPDKKDSVIENIIDNIIDKDKSDTPADKTWQKYNVRGTLELLTDKDEKSVLDDVIEDINNVFNTQEGTKTTAKKTPAKPRTAAKKTTTTKKASKK